MDGKDSEKFYNEFLDMLRKDYDPDKIKGKPLLHV